MPLRSTHRNAILGRHVPKVTREGLRTWRSAASASVTFFITQTMSLGLSIPTDHVESVRAHPRRCDDLHGYLFTQEPVRLAGTLTECTKSSLTGSWPSCAIPNTKSLANTRQNYCQNGSAALSSICYSASPRGPAQQIHSSKNGARTDRTKRVSFPAVGCDDGTNDARERISISTSYRETEFWASERDSSSSRIPVLNLTACIT